MTGAARGGREWGLAATACGVIGVAGMILGWASPYLGVWAARD